MQVDFKSFGIRVALAAAAGAVTFVTANLVSLGVPTEEATIVVSALAYIAKWIADARAVHGDVPPAPEEPPVE